MVNIIRACVVRRRWADRRRLAQAVARTRTSGRWHQHPALLLIEDGTLSGR
jgi:hypothetical protein